MSIDEDVLALLGGELGQGGVVSAHDLRLALRARQHDKTAIALVFSRLVEQGLIERVKITDADGYFYMAYRQTTLQGH